MQPLLFITAFTSFRLLPLPLRNSTQYLTPFHFLRIHFNIIHSYKCRSSKWSLSLTIPKQKPVSNYTLSHTCYMTLLILPFHLINQTMNVEFISLSWTLCSFLHSLVTPSLLDSNIHLSPLFTNTFTLRPSLNMSD